jgi:hypothetical protein
VPVQATDRKHVTRREAGADSRPFDAWVERHKRFLFTALCVVAAVRVGMFIAAFPFFNKVDEFQHFDLVAKYARGHVPGRAETFDAENAKVLVVYDSDEYLIPSEVFR